MKFAFLLLLWAAGGNAAAAETGADGAGAFATGHYRNLFAEDGHAQTDIRAKVDAAFQQLFHGSAVDQTVYFAAGGNSNGPLAYIADTWNHDVRTEGLSYGMMIAVQMDRKAEFDALWNWSKTHLYQASPKHPSYGFFSWQARTNGEVLSEYVAPDGESYYAMALYFAANRWGRGQGIYNYKAQADELLTHMRHRQIIKGQAVQWQNGALVTNMATAGALFDAGHKMILFSSSPGVSAFTDPSYQLPAFYELWARWGPPGDRDFWLAAAAASRDFFPRAANPVTGLTPDCAKFDGTPTAPAWDPGAVNFRADACRTAANWSVDWSWWGKDARERDLSDRLQAFFERQGLATYGNKFTLDGVQLERGRVPALEAMNAVASLAATQPRAKEFVETLWNIPAPRGIYRYYNGLLYMMAVLHCSGEYRIWMPR